MAVAPRYAASTMGDIGARLVLQFAVHQQLHRRNAAQRDNRVDRRRRNGSILYSGWSSALRLNSRRSRIPWSPAAQAWRTSLQNPHQIAASIALAARIHGASAVLRHRGQSAATDRYVAADRCRRNRTRHTAPWRTHLLADHSQQFTTARRYRAARRCKGHRKCDSALVRQLAYVVVEGCEFGRNR